MYTDEDYLDVKRTQRNMRLIIGACSLLLFVPVVLGFVFKIRWMGYLSGALLSAGLVAACYLVLLPIRWYRSYLNEVKLGRRREADIEIVSFATRMVFRDRLDMYEVRCKDKDNNNSDRLLYWDARKEPPKVKPGDILHVLTYDYYIVGYTMLKTGQVG